MKQKNVEWWFVGIVIVLVIAAILFFFFVSPGNPSTSSTQPQPATSTASTGPTPVLTQPGQLPGTFPQELILYPNLKPISGGTMTDGQGRTHTVAEFLPGVSVSQIFNTYRNQLPGLGWTITNSGTNGTSTNVELYLAASKASSILSVTVSNSPMGAKLRLEVVQ